MYILAFYYYNHDVLLYIYLIKYLFHLLIKVVYNVYILIELNQNFYPILKVFYLNYEQIEKIS